MSSRVEGAPWQEEGSFNPKEPPKYLVVGSLVFRSELSRLSLLKVIEHRDSSTSLVLDVNLRKEGYTPTRVMDLMRLADVVKLNEEELELVLEWMGDGDGDRYAALNKGLKDNLNMNDSDTLNVAFDTIGSQFDVEAILLTLGAEGSVLWRRDMGLLTMKATPVEVVDTVGAGDAFLSGVIYGWTMGWNDDKALAFGSKMGAYVAGHRSATPELEIDLL